MNLNFFDSLNWLEIVKVACFLVPCFSYSPARLPASRVLAILGRALGWLVPPKAATTFAWVSGLRQVYRVRKMQWNSKSSCQMNDSVYSLPENLQGHLFS